MSFSGLSTAGAFAERNPFYGFSPMHGMVRFHHSHHKRRMIRGPNKCGKSLTAVYEDWAHAIGCMTWPEGTAPHWAHVLGVERWAALPPPGNIGLIMLADLDNHYPDFCRLMRKLEPGDLLHPSVRYSDEDGYRVGQRRLIKLRNGSIIEFRTGQGAQLALAGIAAAWLHVNEPPKKLHFGEALRALSVSEGPAWMDFTPVGRELGWLRLRVEGSAEQGIPASEEWEQHRPRLTVEDCITLDGTFRRTQESIDAQVASMDPMEVPQRRDGEWDGVSGGRRLTSYGNHLLVELADLPPMEEIRVGMDHGEGPRKKIAYIQGVRNAGTSSPTIYLLGEVVFIHGNGPRDDARELLTALAQMDLSIYDLDRFTGDVNSAGLLGEGAKYNDWLEDAIAAELNLSACPIHIGIPRKRAGSVKARERAINHAMREGRWFVARGCAAFDKSARNYTGSEQDLKDALDAAGYGVGDLLLDPPERLAVAASGPEVVL